MNKILITIGIIGLAVIIYLAGVVLLTPETRDSVTREYYSQAEKIYKFNCSMCHGPSGRGDGPTADALPLSPPDWSNSKWQSAVTDIGIKNAITGGGLAIGRSPYMPAHPDLESSPVLDELVKKIRSFGD